MLPFLARSLLNNTFGGHFHHIYHGDGGGGGRVGSWYFVHIYGRWNEGAGTKITPFKIITEWGGGDSMQRKTKSKMILAPPPPHLHYFNNIMSPPLIE